MYRLMSEGLTNIHTCSICSSELKVISLNLQPEEKKIPSQIRQNPNTITFKIEIDGITIQFSKIHRN